MKQNLFRSVIVLSCINLLNYADRSILPAVLTKIQQEFHLSFLQTGSLGTAFLVIYAVLTIPLAFLADKTKRKYVIAGCVALWSATTALTGLVMNFTQLFVVRSVLGLGEAGYAPATLSLFGDYAPKKRKGILLSIFAAATLVGTAIGYIVGGIVAQKIGWRYAFFIVGLPGLIFGIFALLIFEPQKQKEEIHILDGIKKLSKVPTYWFTVFAYCGILFATGAVSFWLPSYVIDTFHISIAQAGILTGIILLISGTIGVFSGGFLSDVLHEHYIKGRLYVPIGGSILAAICSLIALLVTSFPVFVGSVFLAALFLSATTAPFYALVNDITPYAYRSSAFGISSLISHLLGDAFAPILIGYIASIITLKTSLASTIPIAISITAILCILALRSIKKDLQTEEKNRSDLLLPM